MSPVLPLRHDGCNGGSASGHGICHHAHAGVPDRGVSVQGGVDIHHIPQLPYPSLPLYFLSHQLGADISGTSGLFRGGVSEAFGEGQENCLKHMFTYDRMKGSDCIIRLWRREREK